MKRFCRIFIFCILVTSLSTAIFSQENEGKDSLEISGQKNIFQENDFPKNAVSAGAIYLGLGLEYERLITPAIGVAGTILVYYVGGLKGVWALVIQGRVYPLHFLPDEIADGKLNDALYADIGIGYGESFGWSSTGGGVFTMGIGWKIAVKGPGGFIITPSLNLDMVAGYTNFRVQVLFGYSW